MAHPVVIFTDRDGDEFSVTPREFNFVPDPIITITHRVGSKQSSSHSVVFKENEVPDVVVNLVENLNLTADQIEEILLRLVDIRNYKMIPTLTRCARCKGTHTAKWWKCCPGHTTGNGQDVICDTCANALHPEGVL